MRCFVAWYTLLLSLPNAKMSPPDCIVHTSIPHLVFVQEQAAFVIAVGYLRRLVCLPCVTSLMTSQFAFGNDKARRSLEISNRFLTSPTHSKKASEIFRESFVVYGSYD
ncbi:MAG: hypothetical protein IPN76_17725 [Saprospiraceae bacterium]|nr:hypothetical protein [Saprospiraceae bacterium]